MYIQDLGDASDQSSIRSVLSFMLMQLRGLPSSLRASNKYIVSSYSSDASSGEPLFPEAQRNTQFPIDWVGSNSILWPGSDWDRQQIAWLNYVALVTPDASLADRKFPLNFRVEEAISRTEAAIRRLDGKPLGEPSQAGLFVVLLVVGAAYLFKGGKKGRATRKRRSSSTRRRPTRRPARRTRRR